MAESEGFEPPVPLPVHLISSQAPSTSSASSPRAGLADLRTVAKPALSAIAPVGGAARAEEVPEERGALLAPDAPLHREAVVEPRIGGEVHEGAGGARLGVL